MALYKQDGATCFLWSQGVPLTNFTDYAKGTTERIANNARKLVTDADRPVIPFDHVKTRNLAAAAKLRDRFAHRAWHRVLNAFARMLNPLLGTIRTAGYGGYYRMLDQAEIPQTSCSRTGPSCSRSGPTSAVTPA